MLTSCHGQVKPLGQNEPTVSPIEQAKIPRPQGPNKDVRIVTCMEDTAGNVWFGTLGEGLFKYDGKSFVHYGVEQGLNSNYIYSILQDKTGTIWVGTNKELNRFNSKQFTSTPIVLGNNNLTVANSSGQTKSPIENTVWCMMQDRNRTIWFGTDDGIFCYDGNVFTRFLDAQFLNNKDHLQLKGIFSILEAKNGSLWFAECAGEGIARLDGHTLATVIPYREIGRTDRIIADQQDNLWFATAFKGIGKYDGKTYTPNIFNDPDPNGAFNILADAKGNLWFDTPTGLGFYNGKTRHLFTEIAGTSTRDFMPLLVDKVGNIWFSGKGMSLYKYDGKTLINYSE